MSNSETFSNPPLCVICQADCYKPVCLLEDYHGLQIWAFFSWEDATTLKSVIFSQLNGVQQVIDAKFSKDGKFHIDLGKTKKPFTEFKLNQKLVKGTEYPTLINLNDPALIHGELENIEDPIISGGAVTRLQP